VYWYEENVYKEGKMNGNIEYENIDKGKQKMDAFLHARNHDSELEKSSTLTKENIKKLFKVFSV